MNKAKVAILLASYNGEKYIKEQIDSIINQTYDNWELYIRDDGSLDGTLEIIQNYTIEDDRIHLIEYNSEEHGACINFYNLLRFAQKNLMNYDYYMLSDQDDIWENNKIEIQLGRIKKNIPCLVYSDMILMNEDGITTCRMSDIHNIALNNYPDIFFNQIFVWGNTTFFNSALLKLMNIPCDIDNKLSHDHYLTFYAVTYGAVEYIESPLIKYRRHEENVSGLPSRYSIGKAFVKGISCWNQIVGGHVQMYKNVLYFINHVTQKTTMLYDIEKAIYSGGLTALRIINKYKIVPGANKSNIIANLVILCSRCYINKI